EDGDLCTSGDTCSGGTCMPGTMTECDDQNPCTDDGCDPQIGCSHTNNAAPCDDGDACTSGDACSAGACVPGATKSCDDQNPCTDDACDPQTGCTHVNNTAPCDDGTFCNGADHCQGGNCSVHPGSPCAQSCDEVNDVCIGCLNDPDCGPVTYGAWGVCGGFASTCDTSGTQSRPVTTPHCNSGTCTSTQSTETQACTRTTDGDVCGAVTYGTWSACGGFTGTCAESGTQTRSVTTPTCSGGSCTNMVTT